MRALVAAGLAAATVAGGVGAAPGTVAFAPVEASFGGEVPVQTLPSYGVRGMQVVGYVHGATSRLRLPLRNDGPLPVTVTSVSLPTGVAPLLALREVRGLPVRLAPGERQDLEAVAVLANCRFSHEREVETHDGLRIGFRVLGRPGARLVPFDRPLLVRSPMLVGCPDRLLNRQAADRAHAPR